MTAVVPTNPEVTRQTAGVREVATAAMSYTVWAITIPIFTLHELSHALAARAVGAPVWGAGLVLRPLGEVWRRRLYRVEAAFTLVDPPEAGLRQYVISLAPLAWLPLAFVVSNTYLAIGVLLVGISGFSDLANLLGLLDTQALREETQMVFLWGEPEQWQTRLDDYTEREIVVGDTVEVSES